MREADIGVIGLAVMGENLILNMESKGCTVAVHNRTTSKIDNFVNGRGSGKNIVGCHDLTEFVDSLRTPRKVMLMVKAGEPVDQFIEALLPLLQEGDIIIDGGNSNFKDTIRRCRWVEENNMLYVGTGVSGGEEGALKGPSIMPGGSPDAWQHIQPIFQAIAAKTPDGKPCCEWIGRGGAGHFVKMVHNGIEYGDMQMICETYDIMRRGLDMPNDRMQQVFAKWNEGALDSYLVEITRDILAHKQDSEYVVDKILDTAGQKGTGKWTGINAMDLGQPVTAIAEAVFARCLSALKEQRIRASEKLSGPDSCFQGDVNALLGDLEQALYASKIVSYAQGFMLMKAASEEYDWDLNYGGIALIWQGGCIIRSAFLGKINEAFTNDRQLENLLLDPFFKREIQAAQSAWRRVVSTAVGLGIPLPAISSALAFFDGYRTRSLPANLLQAQRDYFGAHTYERTDAPRGEFFHSDWTGHGGDTAASTYSA